MLFALIGGLSAGAYLIFGTDMARGWKLLAACLAVLPVTALFLPGLLEVPAPWPTLALAFLGVWGGFKLKLDGV